MASALYKRGLRSQFIQRIDGAIVLPAHLADEIAGEAFEMTAFEDFVTERVLAGTERLIAGSERVLASTERVLASAGRVLAGTARVLASTAVSGQ